MRRLVEVVFPLPLDQTFTYDAAPGPEEVAVGHRVLAPFGKRTLTGYVVNLPREAGDLATKQIQAVLDDEPILTPSLVGLARKMAVEYGAPFGQAMTTVLPPGLTRQSRRRVFATGRTDSPQNAELLSLWKRVHNGNGLDFVTQVRRKPATARLFRELEKGGWIRIESVLRNERARPSKRVRLLEVDAALRKAPHFELTPEQTNALSRIQLHLQRGLYDTFLLHGVTGSGKTEVYLRVAQEVLEKGRTVLALVPEIALTPQFVGRFQARFGDQVSVLHSGRSESERLHEWKRIRRGEAKIVIGARSAVFAPIRGLGLVIVDEEHDGSYKQVDGLKYNARDIARWRAEEDKALLILGSATPSLETYSAAQKKAGSLLELTFRPAGQPLPTVQLVDLRTLLTLSGSKGVFSEPLLEAIREKLLKQEQVVLFLNRRGFAPALLCPTCGVPIHCDHCSVAMTFHDRDQLLLCHYCGHSKGVGQPCTSCGQSRLIPIGVGTERVEQDLRYFFPDARILRMDRDSVQKKGAHERILSKLARKEADILIGTQMVTKGIDLPDVTLVGVLMADQALHIPDFRAAERTFQLLTQVVGRSGRANKEGRAIVQTFQPEHYAITAAAAQNYKVFYEREIEYRRSAQYPPFKSLSLIELQGEDRSMVRRGAIWLGLQAKKHRPTEEIEFLGPAPAPIERVDGKSRFHLLLRYPNGSSGPSYARWLASSAGEALRSQKISLQLDIDPYQFV